MFDKPYRFHGSHANRARALYSIFDNESKAQIFKFAKEVYAYAPLVGFLYQRRADLNHEKNPETGEEYDVSIMTEQVMSIGEDLALNFALIMLLDTDYEPDEEKRVDKALRHTGKDPGDEARFDAYVRGGVDVLYEKLIAGGGSAQDYVNRLYDFVDDINERYNQNVNLDELTALCLTVSAEDEEE